MSVIQYMCCICWGRVIGFNVSYMLFMSYSSLYSSKFWPLNFHLLTDYNVWQRIPAKWFSRGFRQVSKWNTESLRSYFLLSKKSSIYIKEIIHRVNNSLVLVLFLSQVTHITGYSKPPPRYMTPTLFCDITHLIVVIPYRYFGTKHRPNFQGSGNKRTSLLCKIGPIGWTETSVRNYHYSLHKFLEERTYRRLPWIYQPATCPGPEPGNIYSVHTILPVVPVLNQITFTVSTPSCQWSRSWAR